MGRIPGVEVLLKHGVSEPPFCEDVLFSHPKDLYVLRTGS